MAMERPRGSNVSPERRQKPLHPHHKSAQEKMLTDGTFKDGPKDVAVKNAAASDPGDKPGTGAPANPTPVPSTPPNNLTTNADQAKPADGTQGGNTPQSPGTPTNTLPLPKGA